MNPHNIRFCIEPGELPGRPRRWERVARQAQAWSRSFALVGAGVVIAKLFFR